jgi:hypothetical protein
MGNEMDSTSVVANAIGVRRIFRSIRSRRGALSAYSLGAIFLGLLAAALFILSVGVFYGYIASSLVGNLTAGEFGIFGFLAAAAAVAMEIAGRRHN